MDVKKREGIFFISVILISAVAIFLFNFQGIGDDKTIVSITGNVVSEDWCNGADINRDGKVDSTDLAILNLYKNRLISNCPNFNDDYEGYINCRRCDLDGDNYVGGMGDFEIFYENNGRTGCNDGTTQPPVTTCTSVSYRVCGVSHPAGPAGSCESQGLYYINDQSLDSSCGEEIGCCCKYGVSGSGLCYTYDPSQPPASTTCENSGYTCGPIHSAGAEASCLAVNRNYLWDIGLDVTCGTNKGCCSTCIYGFNSASGYCNSQPPVASTCTSLGYTCGQTTASGPEISCQLIGKNYLGNTALDATCGSSKGCCSTPITPPVVTLPQCGASQGGSFATSESITSKCTIGVTSGVTYNSNLNKWIWTCTYSGNSIGCNASYVAPVTLCSQQGNVCGNINLNLSKTLSCSSMRMQWANNSAWDSSCNSTGSQGCCIPCAYGFNSATNTCYTSKQRCSTLGGDICNEDTETCAVNYLISSDNRCCPQTCSVKSIITFRPTNSQLRNGYDVELRKGKDKIEFEVNDEEHTLEVTKVTRNTATIKISSNPITSTLSIDDTRRYDLNGDGYYDIKVTLEDIDEDDELVAIDLSSINERVTSSTQSQQQTSEYQAVSTQTIELDEEEDSGSSWYYLIFLIVVLIVFVGVLLYLAYRKKH